MQQRQLHCDTLNSEEMEGEKWKECSKLKIEDDIICEEGMATVMQSRVVHSRIAKLEWEVGKLACENGLRKEAEYERDVAIREMKKLKEENAGLQAENDRLRQAAKRCATTL
eukprot:2323400-Rhodomonas_salina.1